MAISLTVNFFVRNVLTKIITRDVPKNLKRYIKARFVYVFGHLNISIFNFSLAPSTRVRPVVSLWLTIVDSFIAYLSFSRSLSLLFPVSLLLQFFSWFSISCNRPSHPRSIGNPTIRITLENRTDTKQLFNAAYCGFGLSRWNTTESRLSKRLLYEVTVSSIILLSLNWKLTIY